MNKNYDIGQFTDFMILQKENGNDVNNFTFDEIVQVSIYHTSTQKNLTRADLLLYRLCTSFAINQNKSRGMVCLKT